MSNTQAEQQPDYPAPLRELLKGIQAPPLGPGSAQSSVEKTLAALSVNELFPQGADEDLAQCCLSGLWLAYHFLDKSHDLSQNSKSNSGSYWHAIMHRREPDYSNSAYWFDRVSKHPIFAELPKAISVLPLSAAKDTRLANLSRTWDPYVFNDICEEAVKQNSADQALCEQIQLIEWQVLFSYCYRAASAQ